MKNTTNYSIPTYDETDLPDLINGYNKGMGIIDTQMKTNADDIAAVSAKIPTINYKQLTVGVLAAGVNVAYK